MLDTPEFRALMAGICASRRDAAPLVYVRHTFGTHSRFASRPRTLITDQIAACAR